LLEAVIATGIPHHGRGNHGAYLKTLGRVMEQVAGIRRMGAASLELAYVAAGRCDGYWETGLQPWDVAAGVLLVKEAGGFVTDFRGGDRAIERSEYLAANDALHSKLHKLVAGALR
ncbi:MAG: inositol monophosphatase, partial [Sphingomonas sp.]|nr:inositol monophosphatase [Sphingomonas sp.]